MRLTRAQVDRAIERWTSQLPGPVTVVDATSVDLVGHTRPAAPSGATRVVARIERLDAGSIVEQLDGPSAKAQRVVCDLGILEPQDEGLVIVELAPGVSALELQALVGPTLKITHEVAEMVLD